MICIEEPQIAMKVHDVNCTDFAALFLCYEQCLRLVEMLAAHFGLIVGHERAYEVGFARTMPAASLAVEVLAWIEVRRAKKSAVRS